MYPLDSIYQVLHLSRDDLLSGSVPHAQQPTPHSSSFSAPSNVTFAIELDTLCNAMSTGRWRRHATVTIAAPDYYKAFVFERGLSAHWVRVVALTACDACTATFIYT